MKKLFLVAVALIGFNAATHAQGAHLGFKAGLNFADFNGGDLNADSRTGFHVGLVAELRLSDNFAIQPEAIYSSQGVELTSDDLKIDYLNIPVLADIKLFKAVSLQAGPQFGFKVNEDQVQNIGDVKDLDVGGAVGLEVKILKFFAQARYNFGLTDVLESANSPKNAVFQLSAGFNFF
ncbi:porin family protein [Spongiivirga citrea]|uniref:Outer membrane beta-barrel protein n=1 Tax=Spongiivirga citrea TaxID=1481457 RepID=A0A6M0CD19_9FLAO|nr:porin family protein [Spongiivirga citrea]NER15696.1 outer membrane beta-barrel protein [Spongiivirga citrea]